MTPKHLQAHLAGTFPLLEQNAQDDASLALAIDPTNVTARLEWLRQVNDATISHAHFALALMDREPKEAFADTLAAVMTAGENSPPPGGGAQVLETWLALEKHACAKKLVASTALMKPLCKRYGIALRENRKEGTVSIKFPHEETSTDLGNDEPVPLAKHMAEAAFSRVAATAQWARQRNVAGGALIRTVSQQAVQAAVEGVARQQRKEAEQEVSSSSDRGDTPTKKRAKKI